MIEASQYKTSEHSGVEQPEAGKQQDQDEIGGDEARRLVVGHVAVGTGSALDKSLQKTDSPHETVSGRRSPTRGHASFTPNIIHIYKYECTIIESSL